MNASQRKEAIVAYFISITRCTREIAIENLARNQWKLDEALNFLYEQDEHRNRLEKPKLMSPTTTKFNSIVIPSMIEFQRFIESYHSPTVQRSNLLENSSRMMDLAMEYARHQQPKLSEDQLEHWKIHVKVDYTRLQTLLDHDMCAPLLWIEHFLHLLKGSHEQLFDCDYMFQNDG